MTRQRYASDPVLSFDNEDPGLHLPKLKLHDIAPVILPPRVARGNGSQTGNENTGRIADTASPAHGHGRRSDRSDSIVSNASIFASSLRRSSQVGSIRVHRSTRRHADASSAQLHPAHSHTHRTAEPVPFDPFSDAPCYTWLIQDPMTSPPARQYRRDASNLLQFRQWVTLHFPKVVATLKSLQMLHDRPPRKPPSEEIAPEQHVAPPSGPQTEADNAGHGNESDEDSDDLEDVQEGENPAQRLRRQLLLLRRDAQNRAWGILFEHARLLSVTPGDQFVTQDVTPARDVFFVLSGQCQLLFQPKFLDFLVQKRLELKSNNGIHNDKSLSSPHRLIGTPDSGGNSLSTMDGWMRRLSLSTVTQEDASEAVANTIYPLRVLATGEYFGVEACAFRFAHHAMSAISLGALQRNAIGIATPACLHVLVLPFHALQDMRELILQSLELPAAPRHVDPAANESLLAPRRRRPLYRERSQTANLNPQNPQNTVLSGCGFREDDVEFLRHTFVFQSMQRERLQFLATQIRLMHVPKHEYLFTTGQEVLVYIVKSGQLRVFSPEQVRIHTTGEEGESKEQRESSKGIEPSAGHVSLPSTMIETRHVELEILQIHDMVGLMEASLLQPSFSNYCLATSADVWVYVVPPVALFAVLAHEPTCSSNVVQNLIQHHTWYKARKFTALNHHNKQKEFRLSLGAQRKSPIPCSRCGWSGHSSTSMICIRASSPKSAFIDHLMGKDELRAPGEVVGPSKRSSLGMRSQRVASQLQRQPATTRGHPRSGSIVAAPVVESAASSPPIVATRKGSDAVSRGLQESMKGSMLPGLADLASLLGPMQDAQSNEAPEERPKTELEKALDRLDSALATTTTPALSASPWSPVRPQTQQHQRGSTGSNSVSIRDEALKAVLRLSTAASQSQGSRGRKTSQGH